MKHNKRLHCFLAIIVAITLVLSCSTGIFASTGVYIGSGDYTGQILPGFRSWNIKAYVYYNSNTSTALDLATLVGIYTNNSSSGEAIDATTFKIDSGDGREIWKSYPLVPEINTGETWREEFPVSRETSNTVFNKNGKGVVTFIGCGFYTSIGAGWLTNWYPDNTYSSEFYS